MSATEIYLKELLMQGCFERCRSQLGMRACQNGCKIGLDRCFEAGAISYTVLADASSSRAEDIAERYFDENPVLGRIAVDVAKRAEISCAKECSRLHDGVKPNSDTCTKGCEFLWKSLNILRND